MPQPDRREALLAEYSQISSTFQLLTEVRFKLLTFLPLAAGAAVAVINLRKVEVPGLVVSLFGLVVTFALVTYNKRNDQLYDTLVGRAAAIERSLGLPDGAFANRPHPWLVFTAAGRRLWKVDHRTAIATIYYASLSLWLFGVLAVLGHLTWSSRWWIDAGAALVAVALVVAGSRFANSRHKAIQKQMRTLARRAVTAALDQAPRAFADDPEFLKWCSTLSGEKYETVHARVLFLSRLDGTSLAHYQGSTPGMVAAARLVATITDLPPEWLFDCATSRRLSVPS
jgi:hypothetical protein